MLELIDSGLSFIVYFFIVLVSFSIVSTIFPNELVIEKSKVLGQATLRLIFNITVKDAIEMFGPLVIALLLNYIGLKETFSAIVVLMGLIYIQSLYAMVRYLFSK